MAAYTDVTHVSCHFLGRKNAVCTQQSIKVKYSVKVCKIKIAFKHLPEM